MKSDLAIILFLNQIKEISQEFTIILIFSIIRLDVKASDTLQSSSYSVLGLTESTQNGSGNFSPDEGSLKSFK